MAKKKLGFGLMRLPLVDQNEAADVDIEEHLNFVIAIRLFHFSS